MIINIIPDASMADAPKSFVNALNRVVSQMEADFTSSITVNIAVGYLPLNSVELGESQAFGSIVPYETFRAAYTASATTPAEIQAAASMPLTDPTEGAGLDVSGAEAKALGLAVPPSNFDGGVVFNSTVNWSHGPNGFDAQGVIWHELTQAMGRVIYDPAMTPLSLFDYDSPGVLAEYHGGYFSIDGGNTPVPGQLGFSSYGDLADWNATGIPDAFDASISPGTKEPVSKADLTMMDVLGFNAVPLLTQAMATLPTAGESTAMTAGTGFFHHAEGHHEFLAAHQ